ncbi:MAG TPA: HAD-IC family P-type ATPase, partial [Longimicrobiales bacterium]|nr:HAD-IC family P-type ATPase [Longimicrobiales bacterium]
MNAEAGAAKGSANGGSGVESATTPWHTVSAGEAARELEARPEGLTTAEAVERLRRFGPNVVEAERETPWWKLLLHQFTDPLIYILLVAAVVTTLLRDYVDTGVILAVVAINAVIGFVQEYRAQQAMRALARMAAPRATVLRDGTSREIPSKEVVPGDVVLLTSGVRIPADLRIVRTRELEVDESALTGESVPVRKTTDELSSPSMVPGDRTNMAFSGTVVTRGRGRGYVVQTGAATELGRIATAVREIGETRSPLQESMQRFGRMVGVVVAGLAAVTAILGLLRGADTGEIFLMAVALAVSAIPEGLPVVLTVTLAIGVSRMAGRNAIIRALPAVETLGSATVIGSDKTGTLTRNEMTVRAIWAGRQYRVTGGGYGVDGVIQDGNTLADSEHPEHPEHPDPA